jgi:hypothetical protein
MCFYAWAYKAFLGYECSITRQSYDALAGFFVAWRPLILAISFALGAIYLRKL